jgi:hypothetical protein
VDTDPAQPEILASFRHPATETCQESLEATEHGSAPSTADRADGQPDDEPVDVVPVPLPPGPFPTRPPAAHDEEPAYDLAEPVWDAAPHRAEPLHTAAAAAIGSAAVPAPAPSAAVPAPAPAVDDEPFWLPTEEVPRDESDAAWPAPRMRAGRPSVHRSRSAADRKAPPRPPRRTGPALTALVVLSLLAAFFGWVSAEPLWLAVGHGNSGTATVDRCTGSGVAQRCVGRFAEANGRFVTGRVALLGVAEAERHAGTTVRARMVGSESRQAYVGTDGLGLHLRWALGLALVLLCGAGIAWATGATRLGDRLARRRAVLASLAGPLVLAIGFIAAAW